MEHIYKGRKWVVTGRQAYVNREGKTMELLIWQTPCAVCGEPVQARTPERFWTSTAFAAKHCALHKRARAA